MAIEEGYKGNFETLMRAAANGDLGIAECVDLKTRARVIVVCATYSDDSGINFVPVAKMFDGNPYEEVALLGVADKEDGSSSEETLKGVGAQMEFSDTELAIMTSALRSAIGWRRENHFQAHPNDKARMKQRLEEAEALYERVRAAAPQKNAS